MTACPLCKSQSIEHYFQDRVRSYKLCGTCGLVFVPTRFHLSQNEEKAEYDKHQNSPDDLGYRRFLSRVTRPLFSRLQTDAVGLDFGCGPGPTISEMAAEQGIEIKNYDLFYFPDSKLLESQYQFITMTEVIEHISKPAMLLETLDRMLESQAILAIMTKRVINQEAFQNWHYKNDPTHICFYSEATFEWIAQKMSWKLEVIDKDVVFFHKSEE